jgi:hypothetical protein
VSVPAAPAPSRPSIENHIHLLAVLFYVSGGLLLIPALVMGILSGVISIPMSQEGAPKIALAIVPGIFTILCAFFLVGSALRFIAGWGLMKRAPWGRTMGLAMGFFELIHPPFGTILGAYALIVLLPASAAEEYARLSQSAG